MSSIQWPPVVGQQVFRIGKAEDGPNPFDAKIMQIKHSWETVYTDETSNPYSIYEIYPDEESCQAAIDAIMAVRKERGI